MTTWSQLLHLILISAPTRVISQRLAFLPVDLMVQACGFHFNKISNLIHTTLLLLFDYIIKEASQAQPLSLNLYELV